MIFARHKALQAAQEAIRALELRVVTLEQARNLDSLTVADAAERVQAALNRMRMREKRAELRERAIENGSGEEVLEPFNDLDAQILRRKGKI